MNRTRTTLGALFLSALAVCVLGVGSASALTQHECVETTEGTPTTFHDPNCTQVDQTGNFETDPIFSGEASSIEGTITPTTGGVELTTGENTAGEHVVLHSILSGVDVQITCTGFSTPEATATNNAGSPMTVTGTGKWKFSGCLIVASEKAAANCQVPATLETVTLKMTTEEDKLVFQPNAGESFLKVSFTSKAGKTCPAAVVGEKELKGVAKGSVASPTSLEFTKTSGSALTLGGQTAFFTCVTHNKTKKAPEITVAVETP